MSSHLETNVNERCPDEPSAANVPTMHGVNDVASPTEGVGPIVDLFGIRFDALRMPQVLDRLLGWVDEARQSETSQGESENKPTRYVVTPNVDHAVLFQSRGDLREAYETAALVVADGRPVVHASRWLRRPLPECVPGSDLVPALFKAVNESQRSLRVYLLGAAEGVAERAKTQIEQRWPHVEVVGCYSPPIGFEKDATLNESILARVNESNPDVLVVGLGAPKQELWTARHCRSISAPVTLCVGATIDFLAGERRRAPRWIRRLSLEWVHRMMEEPRRLVPRYAKDLWVFPQLIMRQWWLNLRGNRPWSPT